MARIKGIDLPKNKRGVIGLTYIYGIGPSFSVAILDEANISHDIKVQDWTDEQTNAIRTIIGVKKIKAALIRPEFCLVIVIIFSLLRDLGVAVDMRSVFPGFFLSICLGNHPDP